MEITNEQIWEILGNIESKIDALHRFNHSNKFNLLIEEVKIRKRMETTTAMSFCGISRPWALNLMKKIGKEEHFQYINGDKALRKSSIIFYNEAQAAKARYEKMKSLVDERREITFADICFELKLNLQRDLDLIKSIASNLVESEEGYSIKEDNKLCKSP